VAAHPTRRVMLAAAAMLPLTAVSGCHGVDVLAAPPSPAADVTVLRDAIAAEQLLITWYTDVLRDARNAGGSPASLTTVLEPLLAEHREHLSQLKSRLVVPAGSAASPSPTRRAATPTAPGAGSAGVAFLRAAEQAAAAAMLDRLRGVPGSLAQLFASISASEATHVPVLDAAAASTTSQATG
jgi:Ferritin-like domain